MEIILPYIADRYLDKQENDDNNYTLIDDIHLPMTVQFMIDEDKMMLL